MKSLLHVLLYALSFLFLSFFFQCSSSTDAGSSGSGKTIDHTNINLEDISSNEIENAKQKLHIAYGHTSHGSQIVDGMSGLVMFKGDLYAFNMAEAMAPLIFVISLFPAPVIWAIPIEQHGLRPPVFI
ncbi:MAG TPA: hypothetical protein ENO18_00195 [Caldithrix sp.]|nr:hypothetical protein [Caldithrix sp.]